MPPQPHDSFAVMIGRATHAFRRALNDVLLEAGVTLRQWEVLCLLRQNDRVSQNELACALGIEPPTLAGILSRMERDGWLVRTEMAEDRRRKSLRLTAKAFAVCERLGVREVESRICEKAGIDAELRKSMWSACEKILSELDPSDGAPAHDIPTDRERGE